MSDKNIFGRFANNYYEMGLQVIPVDPMSKKPSVSNWQKGCVKAFDERRIESFISKKSDHNIGLCLGPSSGVIAIDIDVERGSYEYNEILKILPKTPCAKIGKKGVTFFYRAKGDIRPFKVIPICEVLSKGNQTVIPPSIHPETKKPYFWVDEDILDCLQELPNLSQSDVDKLNQRSKELLKGNRSTTNVDAGRNTALFQQAMAAAAKGKSIDSIKNELMFYDSKNHRPPYFSDESESKGLSADEFAEQMAIRAVETEGIKDKRSETKRKLMVISKPEKKIYPSKEDGFHVMSKRGFVPEYREFAEYVMNELHLKSDDSGLYMFQNTHFDRISSKHFISICLDLIEVRGYGFSRAKQFADYAIHKGYSKDKKLQAPEGYINLKNGILHIKTGNLEPHSPEVFFDYCLPHSFDESATCPRFDEFLHFIFEDDKERVELAYEILAYCIMGGRPFLEKAFCLLGEGANGKSTYINVIRELLGKNNTVALPMDKINDEKAVATLQGKLASLVEESPSSKMNSENFKNMVSGGEIYCRGIYETGHFFNNTARLVFATNQMPYFRDSTHGNLRKLLFVPFNRMIREHEMDRQIIYKLKAEMSGILNAAISRIDSLVKNNSFTECAKSREVMGEYRLDSDNVYRFFLEAIEVNELYCEKIKAIFIYQKFKDWCQRSGIKNVMGSRSFYGKMRSLTKSDASILAGVQEFNYNNQLHLSGLKMRSLTDFVDNYDRHTV